MDPKNLDSIVKLLRNIIIAIITIRIFKKRGKNTKNV